MTHHQGRPHYSLQSVAEDPRSLGLSGQPDPAHRSQGFLPGPWTYGHTVPSIEKTGFANPLPPQQMQAPLQPMSSSLQQFPGSRDWLSCGSAMDLHSQQDAVVPQPQVRRDSNLMWNTRGEQLEIASTGNAISSGAGTSADLNSLGHGPDWQYSSPAWGQLPKSSSPNQDNSSSHSEAVADFTQRSLPANSAAVPDPFSSFQVASPALPFRMAILLN